MRFAQPARQSRLFLCCLALALAGFSGCNDALSGTQGAQTGDEQAPTQTPPADNELRDRLDKVIDFSELRYMDTKEQGAWQILHGVLAYGRALRIRHEGELVPAVDVISNGGMINGFLLRPGDHGLDSVVQAGSTQGQGHDDQWLAELSQGGMDLDYPIRWGEKTYTLRDMLTQSQWDVRDGAEASWTLMGLVNFLPIDSEWEAGDGTKWNFPRLVEMEANFDVNESACGGTHRLVGLCLAVNAYLAQNPDAKLTGPWAKADAKVQQAIGLAKEYQQRDGAFSANYFARPAETADIVERIGTTGHTLEFLCFAMTDSQLAEPWVANAANHLCQLLEDTKDQPVECGALYHALHGLQLYRYRRFGAREFNNVGQSETQDK